MESNSVKAPSSRGMLIPGKRGRLLANCYLPGGEGPYPVVMICHGIPGYERLMDFAVALREIGFSALCFHCSGSWGSDGDYAIHHCFEDCQTVLDYIARNEFGDFDLSRVYILGHSMGGLMAARTAALSPLIRAACIMTPMNFRMAALEALEGREERYKALIEAVSPPLHGFGWEGFRADAQANIEEMDLLSYADALAEKPVLTVTADRDTLLPKEDHVERFNATIASQGKGLLQTCSFQTDHALNAERPAIRAAVLHFFSEQIQAGKSM